MSLNGVGGTAASVSATVAEPAPAAQAVNNAVKTLYGSPGTVEALANTLQRMQELLQPAQVHVKAAHPEIQ
jgi:hypothetical protein